MSNIPSLRGSSGLQVACDALNRLTYAEMLQLAEELQRTLTAPDAPVTPVVATVADALSQVAVKGFDVEEIAKYEKSQLLEIFKRKRQITVTLFPNRTYQVTMPSLGNVAVVHMDLKQALCQMVDTVVALEAMRK